MNKYIIIGTTSLNRPELHNDNIKEWLEWITSSKQYKYTWFINIDVIDKLNSSYEETQQNYDNILLNKIHEIKYLKNPDGKGNFLKACKRLVLNIYNYIEELLKNNKNIDLENDIKIIWLEDDWKLNTKNLPDIDYLIDNYSSNYSHINLTFIRNNYIWALAPSILSYNLWKKIHYDGWINQVEHIDPEHCLGLHYLKNYKRDEINNITFINQNKNPNNYNINLINSYYTFNSDNFNLEMNDKYISPTFIKDKFKNIDLFIRISPSIVIDGCNYGRIFMEKHNLFKTGIQNKKQIDFYK